MQPQATVRPKAIVVGGRLQTTVKLSEEDIRKACKKRYNGQVDEDLMDEALKASSLKEAVEILVQDTIKHGGDKNKIILTQAELNHRNALMNFEGIFKVLFSEMNKTVSNSSQYLTATDFEKVILQQMGIRRIPQYKTRPALLALFAIFTNLGEFVEAKRRGSYTGIRFKEEKVYSKEVTERLYRPEFENMFIKD